MLRRVVFPFPVGGSGKVDGSGERWKMMFGFFGSSTVMWADQLVSPLAEVAVHVYRPVSPGPRSEQEKLSSENIFLTFCKLGIAWERGFFP